MRHPTTYRAARRNACKAQRGVWDDRWHFTGISNNPKTHRRRRRSPVTGIRLQGNQKFGRMWGVK